MIYRTDRYGRGGDQVRVPGAGLPRRAASPRRVEDYTRQHQNVRVENGMRYGDTIEFVDFPYLAQVTRLNVLAMASLANAPAPPTGVDDRRRGVAAHDAQVAAAGRAAGYRVWWRATTEPQWQFSRPVAAADATAGRMRLDNIVIDDWFFGVSAVSPDGWESPVVFPGDPGSF